MNQPLQRIPRFVQSGRDIRRLVRSQRRAERSEFCDIPCIAFRYQAGGLAQCERSVELVGGKFQNGVAMCPRHGENKIGI